MPTAMRMATTIVPVLVCTTNYGIPLFYSRIIKKKRLFVKCAIKCKIPRLFELPQFVRTVQIGAVQRYLRGYFFSVTICILLEYK
jgi:hypothetical protein